MKRIILIALMILMIATPAMAQGFYHEFTMELDGEWDLNQRVEMPNQSSEIILVGVGKAKMKSILRESPTWWDLF